MSSSAYGRIPVIIFAALALAACPWKKEKKQEEGQHDDQSPSIYYVSASAGLDTNPGTQNSPFKTITRAMRAARRFMLLPALTPAAKPFRSRSPRMCC